DGTPRAGVSAELRQGLYDLPQVVSSPRVAVKLLGTRTRTHAQLLSNVVMIEKIIDRPCNGLRRCSIDEQRRIAHDLGHCPSRAGDHGRTAAHRFQNGLSEPLEAAWLQVDFALLHVLSLGLTIGDD